MAEYQALGTLEELREARDKQIPKKPIESRMQGFDTKYYCPCCEERLGQEHFSVGWCNCGQRLEV